MDTSGDNTSDPPPIAVDTAAVTGVSKDDQHDSSVLSPVLSNSLSVGVGEASLAVAATAPITASGDSDHEIDIDAPVDIDEMSFGSGLQDPAGKFNSIFQIL